MLLTEEQAAKEAGVSRDTISKLIKAGRLRATDYGTGKRHTWRIDPADLTTIEPAASPDGGVGRRRRRRQSAVPSSSWPPPGTYIDVP